VLVDLDHVVAERYGIINVPMTVWVDEDGHVVRPADTTPADDKFRAFTKMDSAPLLNDLRRWVTEGVLPLAGDEEAREHQAPRDADQQAAINERRLGSWLHRQGHTEAATRHLARAAELAPWDWTIRRGSMPLLELDPFFSQEFIAFVQEWDAAGRPGYAFDHQLDD
jgi:hypothetical protein